MNNTLRSLDPLLGNTDQKSLSDIKNCEKILVSLDCLFHVNADNLSGPYRYTLLFMAVLDASSDFFSTEKLHKIVRINL